MKLTRSLESNQKFVNCYSSDVIYECINREVTTIIDKYCMGDDADRVTALTPDGIVIISYKNDKLYNYLISDKEACVYGVKIETRKEKTICFPIYDVELRIILELSCDLPDEDIALFEAMGKIETSYHQATVSKTVFCEINSFPF